MFILRNKMEGENMTEKELIEKRVAREILTIIKSICFSEEYREFRIDRGSNGQRDLIIQKIKEQYLK